MSGAGAAGLIGLEVVPCIVRPRSADDLAQAELALIENVQRADLSAAEEARAYDYLATQHGLSNEEIGRRVGKSRTTIANLRGLLRLPAAVLNRVGAGDGQIPQGVARSLAQIARIATPESIETTVDKMLAQPDLAERYLSIAINNTAIPITHDWADAWPDTPLTATDAAGDVQIPACRGCESFLKMGQTRYCTDHRCYAAKAQLFANAELARIAQKLKVPAATPTEKVEPLPIDHNTSARVKAWLTGETRPAHLRLIAATGQKIGNIWYHKDMVGSTAVLLASTDPTALTRRDTPTNAAPADETPAQKTKRLEREDEERAERRAERALARKMRADVSWLALHTAEAVAPQIAASGATLRYLSDFVVKRVRPAGHWPEVEEVLAAKIVDSEIAKTTIRSEALQREILLLNLINEAGSAYDPKQIYDWDRLVEKLINLCDADALGLKLPRGWDQPPVHRTDSNCWVCGQFTPNDHITKIDEEAGWQVSSDGVVSCSPACRKKAPKGKAPAAKTTQAKKK